jgi:hypothetical protein
MRRVYRAAVLAQPGSLPSPFLAEEAAEYERWRRSTRRQTGRLILSDIATGMRWALPEEYDKAKGRFPGLVTSLRARLIEKRGLWS